jgi:hypothetical protein
MKILLLLILLKCCLQQLLSSVSSLIAYLDCVIELLDHITGKEVNNGGDLFFNRKMQEMHEYSPEIRDLIGTSMLGNVNENGEYCVRQDVVDFIRFLIKQVSDMSTALDPIL